MSQKDLLEGSQPLSISNWDSLTEYQESQESCTDYTDSVTDDEEDVLNLSRSRVIVDIKLLLTLFSVCRHPGCGMAIDPDNVKVIQQGAAVKISSLCNSSHNFNWDSSLKTGVGKRSIYSVNILLATYTLLAGLQISRVVELFKHLDIFCVTEVFFYNLQSTVLHRVIWWSWSYSQETIVEELVDQQGDDSSGEDTLGDCQFDSRGFCAAYGTYVVQSARNKKIIGLWVAHKSMVSSSGEMETFAAKSILIQLASDFKLRIRSLTTDRSTTMKEMMSSIHEDMPVGHGQVLHFFDKWHWIKSVTKDLFRESKLKSCQGIEIWFPSIRNMLWWCFSSSIGNPEELKEKILSIPGHMAGEHCFPDNEYYKVCAHGPINPQSREKEFLKRGDESLRRVEKALRGRNDSRLLDLAMMSGGTETSMIENFNSLHNKYCPKDIYYSHESMVTRGVLAALDYNSNVSRDQAVTYDGSLRYSLVTQRDGKKWTVKKVKEPKDSSWREALAELVLKAVETGQVPEKAPLGEGVERRILKVAKPDKSVEIDKYEIRNKL